MVPETSDPWTCPECGTDVTNCQGIRACTSCDWTDRSVLEKPS